MQVIITVKSINECKNELYNIVWSTPYKREDGVKVASQSFPIRKSDVEELDLEVGDKLEVTVQ